MPLLARAKANGVRVRERQEKRFARVIGLMLLQPFNCEFSRCVGHIKIIAGRCPLFLTTGHGSHHWLVRN